MNEHPIIFSADMVRALLDGRKTMTRRLAWRRYTPPPGRTSDVKRQQTPWQRVQRGDRLWVREAITWSAEDGVLRYAADDAELPPKPSDYKITSTHVPGIFMPRWASRLTLAVTAMKIERLHEISDAEARHEGQPASSANSPRVWFMCLWDALHGAGAWEANPEVVAISFTLAPLHTQHLPERNA